MHRIILFCIIVLAHLSYHLVRSNRCDTEEVGDCLEELLTYEGTKFPFYGEDEAELEQTCDDINVTFACIDDYVNRCAGDPDCDQKCHKVISVSKQASVGKLYDKLCIPEDPFQTLYLESYGCINSARNFIEKCHNISQESQKFILSDEGPKGNLDAFCCASSWHQTCFIEATKYGEDTDVCNGNATAVIISLFHILMGKINTMCAGKPSCDEPPLPGYMPPKDDSDIPTDDSAEKDKLHSDASGALDNFNFNGLHFAILMLIQSAVYFLI